MFVGCLEYANPSPPLALGTILGATGAFVVLLTAGSIAVFCYRKRRQQSPPTNSDGYFPPAAPCKDVHKRYIPPDTLTSYQGDRESAAFPESFDRPNYDNYINASHPLEYLEMEGIVN